MICLIALVVFGILGIFSLKYRKLSKEAFDCTFRKMTLRKCKSNLDERLKSKITGKILRFNGKFGGWIYRNFEWLSWIFTILMIASFVYSAYAIYNLIVYGNCTGTANGVCVIAETCKLSTLEKIINFFKDLF